VRPFPVLIFACSLVLATASCGYRTAPLPYAEPDAQLPVISGASLTQHGSNWAFRWQVPERIQLAGQQQETPEIKTPPASDQPQDPPESLEQQSSTEARETTANEDQKNETGAAPANIHVITRFRINIHRSALFCPGCDARNPDRLLLDLSTGELRFERENGMTNVPEGSRFHVDSGNHFRLNLPAAFFVQNKLAEHSWFTIDYEVASGLLSAPFGPLDTLTLKPVPPPQIIVHKRVRTAAAQDTPPGDATADDPQEVEPESASVLKTESAGGAATETGGGNESAQAEYFLMLEWRPQQETIRHTLQQDGRMAESAVHYGLNLYRTASPAAPPDETTPTEDQVSREILINSSPLLYGRFSLLNFQGRLTARQVDRFGNESESVDIFDGKY